MPRQQEETNSSDLLILILFFAFVVGAIIVAILYTNFMSLFIRGLLNLDFAIASGILAVE